MSIIRDMGMSYFHAKFGGALVMTPDGKAGCIAPTNTFAGDSINITTSSGSLTKARRVNVVVPNDWFDSMEKFNVPDLGWRSAAEGRYMAYFKRPPRTYRKGLHPRDLDVTRMAHTNTLMNSGNLSPTYYSRDYVMARLLFEPEYMPLAEGIEAMNRADIMGFAISNKLAVGPSGEDNTYLLYYEEYTAGTISSDGTINLHIPNSIEELA